MRRLLEIALVAATALFGFALQGRAAQEPITVTGRTRPKILLSVDTPVVDFGSVDPDVSTETTPAFTATVRSNKTYLYALSAPATFGGPGDPDIGHMDWDRWGAAPSGYMPFWGGTVDTVLFAPKTDARPFTYSLRLRFGYDEEPEMPYSADLTVTAMQW